MKLKKSSVIERLVEVPKPAPKNFWPREMKILNGLLKEFPLEFLANLTIPKKTKSLSFVASNKFREKLDEKYKIYSKQIGVETPAEKDYNISEDRVASPSKAIPKKTLRDFLNE